MQSMQSHAITCCAATACAGLAVIHLSTHVSVACMQFTWACAMPFCSYPSHLSSRLTLVTGQ